VVPESGRVRVCEQRQRVQRLPLGARILEKVGASKPRSLT